MPQATKDAAAGVVVTTTQTQDTFFMRVVGNTTFTAGASATAQIGRAGGTYVAPFLVCGTAPGHVPPLLLPDATSATGFVVNELAIGTEYSIYGNDIKDDGRDCGNPSQSFRGNVNTGSSYPIPGEWDTDTGNRNGPTLAPRQLRQRLQHRLRRRLCGGAAAVPAQQRAAGQQLPRLLRRPRVCSRSPTWRTTTSTRSSAGRATINQGGIVGPADPNGSRIIVLTD